MHRLFKRLIKEFNKRIAHYSLQKDASYFLTHGRLKSVIVCHTPTFFSLDIMPTVNEQHKHVLSWRWSRRFVKSKRSDRSKLIKSLSEYYSDKMIVHFLKDWINCLKHTPILSGVGENTYPALNYMRLEQYEEDCCLSDPKPTINGGSFTPLARPQRWKIMKVMVNTRALPELSPAMIAGTIHTV